MITHRGTAARGRIEPGLGLLAVALITFLISSLATPAEPFLGVQSHDHSQGRATVPLAPGPTTDVGAINESSECSSLVSNSSLGATYSQIYKGLPNGQGNGGTGGNESREANQSAYPGVTAGTNQLISAWVALCDSGSFVALYDQWGSFNFTEGTALLSNGYFEVSFGFVYWASCASPANVSSSGCEWFTTWNVNLTNGHVDGPFTVKNTALPGGEPPAQSRGRNSTLSIAGLQGSEAYGAIAAIGLAGIALGVLIVARVRGKSRAHQRPPNTGAPKLRTELREDGHPPNEGSSPSLPPVRPEPRSDVQTDPLSDIF
jgi:hypothetical protein